MIIKTVRDFKNFSANIKVDPSMQRRIAWTKKDVEAYIQALLDEDSVMPIVLADVRQNKLFAIDNQDFESERYFEYWQNLGAHHLSIDGQNRTQGVETFLDDKIRLNLSFGGRDHHNVLFSETPPGVQQYLETRLIYIVVLDNKTRQGLHNTFLRINSGVPLNQCEKINSLHSNVATLVRQISMDYESFWSSKISALKFNRMHELEYVAQALMYLHEGPTVNSDFADIKRFYMENSNINSSALMEGPLRRIITEMEKCSLSLRKNKKLSKSEFWVLYMAFYHMIITRSMTYTLTDPDQFFKVVMSVHKELVDSSEEQFSEDKRIAARSGVEPPAKSSYYFWWIGVARQGDRRRKWLAEFNKKFQRILDDGVLDDCIKQHTRAAA